MEEKKKKEQKKVDDKILNFLKWDSLKNQRF